MTHERPRVAITGATGFIGRRVTDHLRARDYRIRRLLRWPPTVAADIADDEVRGFDLEAGPIDAALLAGCDVVLHLAAHIPRDHADPGEAEPCWRINALGTLRLAEAAAKAGVRHFVHTASANAYAAGQDNPAETAAMFPRSRGFYLGSKIMQEIYADEACRATGLRYATLRLGSVYGPGQTSGAVATLTAQALAAERLALADEGRFGADFVHVDDIVAALSLVVESGSTGTYNVGSGVRSSLGDVARLLVAAVGGDPATIDRLPAAADGDPGFPALSIERLRALGYAPRSLADGLRSMVA